MPKKASAQVASQATAQTAADRPVKIVALGDSLTAGYGLGQSSSFPSKLSAVLKAKGVAAQIQNAGVSGDTSTGGLARLDWSVPEGTEAVILELGVNDALRGVNPSVTQRALETIVQKLRARGIEILLCGMAAPRNMGLEYNRGFDAIYPDLARKYDLLIYPFFLDGVVGNATLNLQDGIHPNARGVDIIVGGITPKVEELIARVRAKRGA